MTHAGHDGAADDAPAAGGGRPRVGDRVTLSARVTGTIPDGAAAVVRVYDRGRGDGERLLATLKGAVRERAVRVPWVVAGRPGYRAHELQLEFDVEAGGRRTPRTRLPVAPERLVEIEITAGSGALEVDAAVPFHVIKTGASEDRPTFGRGQRFRGELPRGYQGKVVVRSGGRPVATFDVGRLPLAADEPIRIRGAVAADGPAGAPARAIAPPARAVADATHVRPGAVAGGAATLGEGIHVHTLRSAPPLADGAHSTQSLGDRAYRWFIKEVFGTNIPPAVISLVQSRAILKEFGTQFYIKDGRYIIFRFRGSPRLRKCLTGTRYRVDHPKVLILTAGGRAGAARAVADGVKSSAVGLFIIAALNVVEGIQKGSSWTDILVDVASDTAKGIVGTVIGVGLIAGAVALAPGLVALAPVGVVVVVGIALGVLIGLGLDWLDSKLGATDAARRAAHAGVKAATPATTAASAWLADAWDDLVVQPMEGARQALAEGLSDLEDNIRRRYGVPARLPH
jgi:hypothetical protein